MPKLTYVQFLHSIAVGGGHGTISGWSADKHGPETKSPIAVDITGNFVTLTTIDGLRAKVPLTNVASLLERMDEDKKAAPK